MSLLANGAAQSVSKPIHESHENGHVAAANAGSTSASGGSSAITWRQQQSKGSSSQL